MRMLHLFIFIQMAMAGPEAAFLEKAESALKRGDTQSALEYFHKANNPVNEKALDGIARVAAAKKDYVEMARALEILLQKRSNYEDRLKLAIAYQLQPDVPKAIDNYKMAIADQPKRIEAYEGLLKVYQDTNNIYEGSVLLKDLSAQVGESPRITALICAYKVLEDYYDEAKKICADAIAKAPEVPESHIYLGLAFRRTEDPEQGNKIILAAANRFKNSEFAQRIAGDVSDELKRFEQSVVFYGRAVELAPTHKAGWVGLAKAKYELQKYSEAMDAFTKACMLDASVDLEFKKYGGLLRQAHQDGWYHKFKDQADRCRDLRLPKTKKIKE